MPEQPARVMGVYERVPGSDVWAARLRVKGKLVRKSFGRGPEGRAAAIAWVEKAGMIRRTGEGILRMSAQEPVLTTEEVAALGNATAHKTSIICLGAI
jgi:hypothetical protein